MSFVLVLSIYLIFQDELNLNHVINNFVNNIRTFGKCNCLAEPPYTKLTNFEIHQTQFNRTQYDKVTNKINSSS